MRSLLPAWPLACTSDRCRPRAFTYPRAATLADAYLEASMHGWTVAIFSDAREDRLLCPRCSPPLPYH